MLVYNPDIIPNNIIVVGCGGTGSRVVPLLTQLINSQEWLPDPWITLVDDDTVEEKNLARQNFIAPDLGKNKAAVLTERYSNAFMANVTHVDMRVGNDTNIHDLPYISRGSNRGGSLGVRDDFIVIMCVDSPEARRSILTSAARFARDPRRVLILDAGNEDTFGQVKIFNAVTGVAPSSSPRAPIRRIPDRLEFEQGIPFIPAPVSFYRDMVAGESSGSCADLDQTMAINNMMSAMIVGLIQNVLFSQPILYHTMTMDLNGSSHTQWMDIPWFKDAMINKNGDYFVKDVATYHDVSTDTSVANMVNLVNIVFNESWVKWSSIVSSILDKQTMIDSKVEEETNTGVASSV